MSPRTRGTQRPHTPRFKEHMRAVMAQSVRHVEAHAERAVAQRGRVIPYWRLKRPHAASEVVVAAQRSAAACMESVECVRCHHPLIEITRFEADTFGGTARCEGCLLQYLWRLTPSGLVELTDRHHKGLKLN